MTDENMTGTDAEGVDWGEVAPTAPEVVTHVQPGLDYPEHPDNPHNHRFTLSVTGDKAPMMVIRGNTAADITAAINELEAYGVWANVGAAHASMRAQGALGAGLGPVSPVAPQAPAQTGFPAPPAPQGGATPPPFGPNVSVPQAPGYQGPPATQGWGAPPPAQGGGQGPQPRPDGWLRMQVPFNDSAKLKGLRAQGSETGNYLRGKVKWGDKGGVYWVEPSVAGWLAQQGFAITQ